MVTIEPGVLLILLGWGGTVLTALAYVLKTRADTQKASEESRGEVAKTEAASDGRLTEAILSLAQSLNANSQQAGVERQQTLMAIEKSGGRVEGMMVAIVDNTKTVRESTTAIKDLVTTVDEFGPRLQQIPQIKAEVSQILGVTDSLETNLGETLGVSISEQLKPVADALIGIDIGLKTLAEESHARDNRTNGSLLELISLFQEAKKDFMKVIEPIVVQNMRAFLPEAQSSITSETPVEVSRKETLEEKEL
jgi:uncharacterized protein YoaH (UPF0181 family)